MAVTYNVAVKTDRMTATRDYFAGGTLEIQDSGGDPLAVFTLTGTGGTIATDTWTLAFTSSTVAAGAAGTASQAVIKTSGGNAHLTGLTVGLSASDIIIDNMSINSGQNVNLTSATIQHA
jgi:hypothetical protein